MWSNAFKVFRHVGFFQYTVAWSKTGYTRERTAVPDGPLPITDPNTSAIQRAVVRQGCAGRNRLFAKAVHAKGAGCQGSGSVGPGRRRESNSGGKAPIMFLLKDDDDEILDF